MRDNGPVTNREVLMKEDDILVSGTDTGGRIQFANKAFADISGFSETELIDAPHNIVRHKDMPKEAFANLWATIKAGLPWQGLVKNRTKTGDHYWVRANVTPTIEDAKLQVTYPFGQSRPTRRKKTPKPLIAQYATGSHKTSSCSKATSYRQAALLRSNVSSVV